MSQNIELLIDQATKTLLELGLKPSVIKNVKASSFSPIIKFYASRRINCYSNDLMRELEGLYKKQRQEGDITQNTYNYRIRGVKIIREIAETGTFKWKVFSRKESPELNADFTMVLTEYLSRLETNPNSTRGYISIVERFFLYLQEQGVLSTTHITPEDIQQFIVKISATRPKGMGNVVTALRKLIDLLAEKGVITYSAGCIGVARKQDRKILTGIPEDDFEKAVTSIDRSTPIGKRDYAILLLGASTGLRACDIVTLKQGEINWIRNEICIVQSKTDKPLILPLKKSVGSAIAEYILEGRPTSAESNVFLRARAPFIAISSVAVENLLYRSKIGADIEHVPQSGKAFHGIRRMLGKSMAENDVPVTTLAQVLGHVNFNSSTKQYIAIDIKNLRECALSFDSLQGGSLC